MLIKNPYLRYIVGGHPSNPSFWQYRPATNTTPIITSSTFTGRPYVPAMSTSVFTGRPVTGAVNIDYSEEAQKLLGEYSPQPPPPPPQLDYSGKGLSYNVGCVTDAYFSPKASFHKLLSKDASGAIQDKPVKVESSSQLWSAAGKTKGMISLFIPPNPDTTMDAITPAEGSNLKPAQWELYSFQFHYNPTSVSMTYAGTPAIDIALSASGGDPFNLLGQQGSQSVIDFDLVLNRVADFKYYNADGTIKSQYKNKNIYSPRMPKDTTEEKEIYNKGTMYDVEFLLSSVIGFKSDTSLRGTTADLGWLTGRPVKLSLGKSLKYVGTIDGFSVNHTMFDVRMVPIFSTVKISFKRIPDFTGLVE